MSDVYTLPEWSGFISAIRANPADDLPRLVAADWLEEHGENERAEFVRVQVEIARIDMGGRQLPMGGSTRRGAGVTSENRQRLASAFELLLSYAGRLQDPSVSTQTGPAGSGFGIRVEVYGKSASHFAPHTDLSPFQAMCLAGLLGDPGQLESAVVDYAIEAGVDVVTAAHERGKRDERERCVELLREESSRRASPMSWMRGEDEVLGEAADIISNLPTDPPAHADG